MKKLFLFATMASVALASCTNDESVLGNAMQSNEIKFQNVEYSTQTRAEHDATAYTGGDIKVFAWKDGADDVFMNGVTLNNAGEIQGADKYYWPSYALDFAAYTPTTSPVSVGRASGATTLTYTFTNAAPNTADVNYMYADYVDAQTTGTVALLFRHAMAKVGVTVKKSADTNSAGDAISVNLTSAKIVGVKNEGTFVVNESNDNTASRYWTSPAGSAEIVIPANADLSTTGEKVTDYYAMPQAFTDAMKFVLSYTVTIQPTSGPAIVTDYNKEILLSAIALTQNNLPAGESQPAGGWGTNKSINYNITINPGDLEAITFSVEEETWGTVAGADQTLN